ncbi:MAG: hypothetical protein KatS3mg111_2836 [Pirellulaceae bacterium]|nr:MAG: hypothetical protein KatS3mg111_2836 [Pirellulaceae bacterium]
MTGKHSLPLQEDPARTKHQFDARFVVVEKGPYHHDAVLQHVLVFGSGVSGHSPLGPDWPIRDDHPLQERGTDILDHERSR